MKQGLRLIGSFCSCRFYCKVWYALEVPLIFDPANVSGFTIILSIVLNIRITASDKSALISTRKLMIKFKPKCKGHYYTTYI